MLSAGAALEARLMAHSARAVEVAPKTSGAHSDWAALAVPVVQAARPKSFPLRR